MTYPLILQIETSGDFCSVALSAGEECMAWMETSTVRNHATMLTPLIEALLVQEKITVAQLAAIAVSIGPGSYTGLRIGVSTAKGLCFGAGIPLIAVPTLKAMARRLLCQTPKTEQNTLICPMIDARRMEVYTALFDTHLNTVKDTVAEIIDEHSFESELACGTIYFAGNGADKCKKIITHPHAIFPDSCIFSAKDLIPDAWQAFQTGKFADVAYTEPFYLKDFMAGPHGRNIKKAGFL
ncbi:MAG: tRNA (adenosine(37)-N6)-threonylcarbamoyltransferase complex dimerization subunit type 1 TsaB [Bacteroidales bacterium]|jgi:tRNA threonylcarbamoyladenosine biosynthesis protein TsaB|nr:tRNA (adenosine(37)-N6)-threonylcarbamoyltransferase complex dimerization subunit type 1 TsaB [Bacteroidales bacterium]